VTLARDLRTLIDLGFELDELEAFDMFPETHHLEVLVWLRAPGAPGAPGVCREP
jgi:23S rRNA (uracil1939-C5)-methyltransferase